MFEFCLKNNLYNKVYNIDLFLITKNEKKTGKYLVK